MFQPPWVSGSELKANRTQGKAQSGMMRRLMGGRNKTKLDGQKRERRAAISAATPQTHPEEEDFSKWLGGAAVMFDA